LTKWCAKVVFPVNYKMQQQRQQFANSKRILIVEGDNRDNYATLKLDLVRNAFIVDIFTDPLAALKNFRAGLFDMVVLD
jgi:PleD family two-component response regulator